MGADGAERRASVSGAVGATDANVASRRPLILRVPIARVAAGIADLRAEADDKSELVDQVRHGERVTILRRGDGWLFAQAREDHYVGWIRDGDVVESAEVPGAAVVAVGLAPVFDDRWRPADALPAGTWIEFVDRKMERVAVRGGWVRASDLAPADRLPLRSPTPDDVVAAARAFLDVPYLWGGTSALGLDCSGFVQLAYRLCGILMTRDADQQATQGRAVEGALRAGDLLFFGSPVTHVGMALDAARMIHAAAGTVGRVVEQEVAALGTPVAIRRFLPW